MVLVAAPANGPMMIICKKRCAFLLRIGVSQGVTMSVRSLPRKSRRRRIVVPLFLGKGADVIWTNYSINTFVQAEQRPHGL